MSIINLVIHVTPLPLDTKTTLYDKVEGLSGNPFFSSNCIFASRFNKSFYIFLADTNYIYDKVSIIWHTVGCPTDTTKPILTHFWRSSSFPRGCHKSKVNPRQAGFEPASLSTRAETDHRPRSSRPPKLVNNPSLQ